MVCKGMFNRNLKNMPPEMLKVLKKIEENSKNSKEDKKKLTEILEFYKKYAEFKEVPYDYLRFSEEIIAETEKDLEKTKKKYPKIFKFVDLVQDVVVSVGNHPAGCVVSPFPVDSWFGTFTTKDDIYPVSVLNMKEIDSLNFVKLDVLGLDNIGLIYKTCDLAGIPFLTPDNTPPDDIDVWNSIRDDTTMIFQWESESASAYLKRLFSDETIAKIKENDENFSYMNLLSLGNGAIRPAGKSYREDLAQGIYKDHGNDALNEFMKPTLGYCIYQCQIIEFLHKFCGFTMGEADIVRRHFSKKTGTETDIPIIKNGGYLFDDKKHYIKGFMQTMKDDYGVEKEEAEEIIKSFLQVIIDASDYLFSKNHSDPYSWIGYICGYLRYHYPLEFVTSALNIFEDKKDKSLEIIKYAKKNNIKISPIKFRHSVAKYTFSKETNEIFKGISSISGMNETIADELYALRNVEYSSFIDLLLDIKTKTTVNSGQLTALIELDFFEEFGDANLLLKQSEMFDNIYGRKQIKKEKIAELGTTEDIIRNFAGKETEKMFTQIDSMGLLNALIPTIKYKHRSLKHRINAQIKYLGYIDIVDEKYKGLAVVSELNTKYSPKASLYSLKNGTTLDCKISKRTFNRNKLEQGDIVIVSHTKNKPKVTKDENGDWVEIPNTSELWVESYKIIENI